ncbi:TetR/AcrR family transcriptional regulator [Nocardioides sp.]|uniref:TetR/AcrR family transcriptional regulator n=1 Tax=Nocardioides sp. TaxID=35761 RepID=UPI00352715B1
MPAAERRDQLIDVARAVFSERGYDGAAIEDIAARARVSKPVVYEHFGGKEGLYSAVVDHEVDLLLERMTGPLTAGVGREVLELAANALLDYIEQRPSGFRILVRDTPRDASNATFQSIMGNLADRVEGLLTEGFEQHGLDPRMAPLYSQMLIGMGSQVGLWWLDTREPDRRVVSAHLVNMAWNGLSSLETDPGLSG